MTKEAKAILKNIKTRIGNIRKKIRKIIDQKRTEIKDLKRLEQKYGYTEQILGMDFLVDSDVMTHLEGLSDAVKFVEENFNGWQPFKVQDDSVYYIASVTATSASTSLVSYPGICRVIPDKLKLKMSNQMSGEHEKKKEKVGDFLSNVKPHLKAMYLAAYENLDMVVSDPERAAIGLMREIINQVLHSLASDDEIKQQKWFVSDSNSKTGITRKHRVRFIAETRGKSKQFKELILRNAQLFDDTVKVLNKFHKHGELNVNESKDFFYQAEALLEILSDSINL